MRTPRPPADPRPATTPAKRPAPELVVPRGARPAPTGTRLHTRRMPVVVYVAALILLPALVVGGFVTAGWWATTGTTTTARTGDAQGSDGGGADPADPADPADVKGSMTVEQVVGAFPAVTAAQVLAQFGAPLDTPTSTQLKELVEAGGGTDIPGLRTWLQEQVPG